MTTKNIGQVAPGTTVKIVDPETGQRLGPNKVSKGINVGPLYEQTSLPKNRLKIQGWRDYGKARTGRHNYWLLEPT